MKFKQQISKVGNSLFILIPLNVRKELEIEDNDYLEVEITKVKEDEDNIKTYFCTRCTHYFSSGDIEHELMCPICIESDCIELIEDENQ
jgi:hypothetical protein